MNQYERLMYSIKEELTSLGISTGYGTIYTGYLESYNTITLMFNTSADMNLYKIAAKEYRYGRYNQPVNVVCKVT